MMVPRLQVPGSVATSRICSHCLEVLSTEPAMVDLSDSPMAWTLCTLQRIVYLGSVRGGRGGDEFLSDLSSRALCNLLVLLKLNARTLCKDMLRHFLGNIEELVTVKRDEWCMFLIQHLRGHVDITSIGPQQQEAEKLLAWVAVSNTKTLDTEALDTDALDTETLDTETLDTETEKEEEETAVTSVIPSPSSDSKAGVYTVNSSPSFSWVDFIFYTCGQNGVWIRGCSL